MGKSPSKSTKKQQGGFVADPHVNRIISLGGGGWAYLLMADGKTTHVRRGSDTWNESLAAMRESFGAERVNGWLSASGLDLMPTSVAERIQQMRQEVVVQPD